ncbi:hypothetical protein [Clostridium septicum]|uniref:hypothetical protein n=1 Tax=Clostridium septicum TaxID=1504 RepID=UPI000FF8D17F|nr:hypothetical protein [Clostridium septicum]QAS62009.1 hypothetical protein EI377_15440 [Clostridium septicum]
MIKIKVKKIICAALASGVLIGVTPALNIVATTNEVIEDSNLTEEQLEQLNYAIEEMKIAIDLVDNADFTDGTSYERMVAFATASLDRVRGLEINNEHVEWIEESGDEVRDLTYRINRVLHAIKNVEIVFSEDRQDTVENKENVINTLNLVLTQEMEVGILNNATLRSAVNILHMYNGKIDSPDVEKPGLTEEQLEQLNYAIEEMKIAIDLVDNADFTDGTSYERMVAFATASLDRVRGLEISNEHVEWIEESGDEVRDLTYRINRVLHAIKNVEVVFSEERQDTVENKQNVLDTLKLIISQEETSEILNEYTIESAKNIYKHYYAILNFGDGSSDDDMLYPGIGEKPEEGQNPEEGEKPEEGETPEGGDKSESGIYTPTDLGNNDAKVSSNKQENSTELPKTGAETTSLALGFFTTLLGLITIKNNRK